MIREKSFNVLCLLVLLTLGSFALAAKPSAAISGNGLGGVESLSLSGQWRFKTCSKDQSDEKATLMEFDDSNWDSIKVPGNWDTYNKYAHYVGKAWYRKSFTLGSDWKGSKIFLRFEAVYETARVWLNGKYLGEHVGGYTPFEFDVTELINYSGDNVIAVEADNSYRRGAWWNWGGISRDVKLVKYGDVRIVYQHITASPDLKTKNTDVRVQVKVRNYSDRSEKVELSSAIFYRGIDLAENKKIEAANFTAKVSMAADSDETIEIKGTISGSQVELWDFDHPHLYQIETAAFAGKKHQHKVSDRFGIRRIEITDKSFLLNGKPIRLCGFNRVHDHRAWGNSEPEHLIRADVDDLKSLGAAMSRMMHAPMAVNLLDYLDQKGYLIIEEIPVWGKEDPRMIKDNPITKKWLDEMIERDYNHACIIGWSVGNELSDHYDYVTSMLEYVRKLDPTRIATDISFNVFRDTYNRKNEPATNCDYIFWNSYGHSETQTRATKSKWPERPTFISEFGKGQTNEDLDKAVFKSTLFENIDYLRSDFDYITGFSIWTYNDYRSNYRGTPPSENRAWGVVDVWRQRKNNFADIQAQLSPVRLIDVSDVEQVKDKFVSRVTLYPRQSRDMPFYEISGYKLVWLLTDRGGKVVDGGFKDISTLDPGDDPFAVNVTFNPQYPGSLDLTISVISPLGYIVREKHLYMDVPVQPKIKQVIAADGSVRILFDHVVGAEKYFVIYSNGKDSRISETAFQNSYIDITGLQNKRRYTFTLVAQNQKGQSESSDIVTATPCVDQLPPIVQKTVALEDGFMIGYSCEPDDISYSIKYGEGENKLTNVIDDIDLKGAYAIRGLKPGSDYYFSISRRTKDSQSNWSNIVKATAGMAHPLPSPEIQGVVKKEDYSIIKFQPAEFATAYLVEYHKAGSDNIKTKKIDAAKVSIVIIEGLEKEAEYVFEMKTLN